LDDFLSGAKDGFILFSLGSIVQAKTMPPAYRQIFVNVFAKLKQRVIWKWEEETMEGLPPNVKLSKWLPQQDILGIISSFTNHAMFKCAFKCSQILNILLNLCNRP